MKNNTPTATTRAPVQALVDVARSQPPVRYDVTRGLVRHQRMVAQGAPLPAWDDGSTPVTAHALVSSSVVTGVVVTAIGALLVAAAWQARRPVPSPPVRMHSQAPAHALPSHVAATSDVASAAPPLVAAAPAPKRESAAMRVPAASAHVHRAGAKRVLAPRESAQPAPAVASVQATAPAAVPEPPSDLLEMHELARAEALLTRDPAAALTLLNASERRFARGYFRHERAYFSIMALIALQRTDSARRAAERFLRSYPQTPYRDRVRRALEGAGKLTSASGE
jgi:hypothetical protein